MSESTEQGTQVLGEEPNAAPQPDQIEAPDTGQEQTPANTDQANSEPDQKPTRRPWFEKVIAERSFEAREYKRETEALRARLARYEQPEQQTAPQQPPGYVPVTEVERAAVAMLEARTFNAACDQIADAVEKIGDLSEVQRTFRNLGGVPPAFLEAVVELGTEDGARVYADLGANPDEADRIFRLSPARMAVELARMAAKPAKPAISKTPPPIRPVGGSSTRNTNLETMDDDAFRDEFTKQWNARRYGR